MLFQVAKRQKEDGLLPVNLVNVHEGQFLELQNSVTANRNFRFRLSAAGVQAPRQTTRPIANKMRMNCIGSSLVSWIMLVELKREYHQQNRCVHEKAQTLELPKRPLTFIRSHKYPKLGGARYTEAGAVPMSEGTWKTSMNQSPATKRVQAPEPRKLNWWIPRLWLGCGVMAWGRMLAHNRLAVRPSCWPRAVTLSICSIVNSSLGVLQRVVYHRRISRTNIGSLAAFYPGSLADWNDLPPRTLDPGPPSHVSQQLRLLRTASFPSDPMDRPAVVQRFHAGQQGDGRHAAWI